jgi:hypothetical protein
MQRGKPFYATDYAREHANDEPKKETPPPAKRTPFYATDYAREHANDEPEKEAEKPVCPACDLAEMLKKHSEKNKTNQGVKK